MSLVPTQSTAVPSPSNNMQQQQQFVAAPEKTETFQEWKGDTRLVSTVMQTPQQSTPTDYKQQRAQDAFDSQIAQFERNKAVFKAMFDAGYIRYGEWAVVVNEKLVKTGSSENDVMQGIDQDCYCARAGYLMSTFMY